MRRKFALPALLLLLLAAACDNSPTNPSRDAVAGSYRATTFTVTNAGTTTDLLRAGATIELNLSASGTTTGRFFVPGGQEDGSDLDADLTGTWTLNGSTVAFDQTADTVLRDMTFTVSGNRLEGTWTSGETVRIVLSK